MLPTFVIGLREGLEAALIVGIIAAFLRKQGRRDLVRWVFLGVGAAVLLCLAVGVALDVLSRELPQRQQEGLETVIGALAVGMVTYMVVWMRRHSRELKGQLETLANGAMTGANGGRAMVLMAFLAVLREGFETVVFLLAAFNEAGSNGSAALGAVLGIAIAVVLGYGIYRGGVRLNLSKFFRATGLVLVLVAAGLVLNALHTAHEAGWLNVGQGSTVDLSWLVAPNSVRASLLTGMLGLQPHPVVIEVIGWLVYLVPVGLYVGWPPGRALSRRTTSRLLLTGGAALALTAIAFATLRPGVPGAHAVTSVGGLTAQVVSTSGDTAVIRTQPQSPVAQTVGATTDLRLTRVGTDRMGGVPVDRYTLSRPADVSGLPKSLTADRISQLSGGRLPIGLHVTGGQSTPATYAGSNVLTVVVEPHTSRIIDLTWAEKVVVTVHSPTVGALPLSTPAAAASTALPAATVRTAEAGARHDVHLLDRRGLLAALTALTGLGGLLSLLAGLGLARRQPPAVVEPTPAAEPGPEAGTRTPVDATVYG